MTPAEDGEQARSEAGDVLDGVGAFPDASGDDRDETGGLTSRFLQTATQERGMSLTTDDFEDFMAPDPEDDQTVPLGDALDELALDVEVDSVEAVRDVRERL